VKFITRYSTVNFGEGKMPCTNQVQVNERNKDKFYENMFTASYCDFYLQPKNVQYLYYFSRIENLDNIIKHGILSYNEVNNMNIDSITFAEETVQVRRDRRNIFLSNNMKKNLHDLVPLYFKSKTPTLYARKDIQDKIFFCKIETSILSDKNVGIAFTDGNAASDQTKFYWNVMNLTKLNWDIILDSRWNDYEDGRRQCNSEFLIYPKVSLNRINEFIVINESNRDLIIDKLQTYGKDNKVSVNKELFF